MTIAIPTLTTERLTLRGPEPSDFADSLTLWSDPAVTRFIGGVPATEEDVWSRLLRYVGHWALLGFGMWVVCDRNGAYVGEVGFLDARRAITPPLEVPEVGWVLRPDMHGKGYASEAVRAALAWAEAAMSVRVFSCIIDPDNAASLRVAQKCGFHEVARTTYKGTPTIVHRRG